MLAPFGRRRSEGSPGVQSTNEMRSWQCRTQVTFSNLREYAGRPFWHDAEDAHHSTFVRATNTDGLLGPFLCKNSQKLLWITHSSPNYAICTDKCGDARDRPRPNLLLNLQVYLCRGRYFTRSICPQIIRFFAVLASDRRIWRPVAIDRPCVPTIPPDLKPPNIRPGRQSPKHRLLCRAIFPEQKNAAAGIAGSNCWRRPSGGYATLASEPELRQPVS